MTDITAIILTRNEEANIRRCIESLKEVADRILVVDSGSTDRTVEIAESLGAETYFHAFVSHGNQFNWALDQIPLESTWIFRVDADEVITPELAREIVETCRAHREDDVNGFLMKFRVYFLGRFLRYGGAYPFRKMNMLRRGCGRFDERNMHDNILLSGGRTLEFEHDALHYDQKDITAFVQKHNWYSSLEASNITGNTREEDANLDEEAKKRSRLRNGVYYRLPKFFRAKLYFWYRYYVKLGFLDGQPGKVYAFIQSYMYRYLVDAKILEEEIRQKQNTD